MRYLMILIATTITLFSLNGCATQAKYQAKLATWEGKPIQQFIDAWGYPNNTVKLENNQTAYVYENTKIVSSPPMQTSGAIVPIRDGDRVGYIAMPGPVVGGQTYSLNCTTWVIINDNTQKIVKTSFRGNNCVAS